MGSVKHLLLYAVLPLLVRCQNLQVLMEPPLKMAFTDDSVNLKCVTSATSVTWHKPNGEQILGAATLNVKIKSSKDGGLYQCEANGMKSDSFLVNVTESKFSASLTIQTGSKNMQIGGAVILKLENKNGLQGWRCWVYRSGKKTTMVPLNLEDVSTWMVFQTGDLIATETFYWCTDKPRGQRSNQVTLTTSNIEESPEPVEGLGMVLVGILLVLVGVGVVIVLVVLRRRRRSEGGRVYEDVALRTKERGDDKYETLQKASGREREYDTLAGASGRESKGGEYEALKKEEMKEGVYHTLGAEGAAGGGGGYEALKKEGMKEGVYHTLGVEGAAGGEGGYEALKKEGMKEGVYHTLGVEGAAGGEGGYEAVGRKDKPSESATEGE